MTGNEVSRLFVFPMLLCLLLSMTVGCSHDTGAEDTVTDSAVTEAETERVLGEIPYTIIPPQESVMQIPEGVTPGFSFDPDPFPEQETEPESMQLPDDKDTLYSGYVDGIYSMEDVLTQNDSWQDALTRINEIIRIYNKGEDVTAYLTAPTAHTTRVLPPDRTELPPYTRAQMAGRYRCTGDGRHKFSFPLSAITGGNPDDDYLDFYFDIRVTDGTAALEIDDVRIYSLREKLGAFHPPGTVSNGVFCGRFYRYSFYQFDAADGHLCLYATEDNGDTFTECPITEPDTLDYDSAEVLEFLYMGRGDTLDLLILVALTDERGTEYAQYQTCDDFFPEFRYQTLDEQDVSLILPHTAVVYPNLNLSTYADSPDELHVLGLDENDARLRYIRALISGDIAAVEALCQVEPGAYDSYQSMTFNRWIAGSETDADGKTFVYFALYSDTYYDSIYRTASGWYTCRIEADDKGVFTRPIEYTFTYFPEDSRSAGMLYTFLTADGVFCRVYEGMPDNSLIPLTAFTYLDRSRTVPGPMIRYLMRNIDGIWVTEEFFEIE